MASDHHLRFLVLLLLLATPLSLRSSEPPPHVLLVVADDLGFSDPGCFGGEIATPALDRLAAGGVRLTQFTTTGRCCPSRASLLTGLYPHRAGLGHMTIDLERPGYRGRISDSVSTIAERLAARGYRSFLSGKWHLGTPDPTRHGFEEFYGTLVSAKTFWEPDHFLRLPDGRSRRSYGDGEFYGTHALADHALDFLELAREKPGKPWFLYLAFHAPHFPLHAPRAAIERQGSRYDAGWDALRLERLERQKKLGIVPRGTELSPRSPYYDWGAKDATETPAWSSLSSDRRRDLARRMAIYAAMVEEMDRALARVLADLERHGELENTLVLFTSDNGACAEWDHRGFDGRSGPDSDLHRGEALERMGSRGTYHSVGAGWAGASNTPWRLYKHFNHEGGIATPCIIHWPRGQASGVAGSIDASPAHLIDVVPTLLEAAGLEADPALPGVSLLPVLGGQALPRRDLFYEHEGNRALRSGPWKLVGLRRKPWELYDLRVDRIESHDLAARHPERVDELVRRWESWAKREHVTPLPGDYRVRYLPVLPEKEGPGETRGR